MATAVPCVILQVAGKVATKSFALPITKDTFQGRRKEAPKCIGDYKYGGIWLHVYAYTESRGTAENKHELPPPNNELSLYGDAYITASKDTAGKIPTPFNSDNYAEFYKKAFQSFDDDDVGEAGEEDISESDEEDETTDEEEEEETNDDEEEIIIPQKKEIREIADQIGAGGTGGAICQPEAYTYPPGWRVS